MYSKKVVKRFWSKVDQSGSCWLWLADRHDNGYGYFFLNGRMVRAHRLAWQLVNGPISSAVMVCHKCDNPSCVNPSHLFIGSGRDNSRDMRSKGRGRGGWSWQSKRGQLSLFNFLKEN